jgi:predicted nucleotidyltransferase
MKTTMDMREEWLHGLSAWASKNDNVRELWLFGSRADGTSRQDSDVDIGVGLMPATGDHNWAFAHFISFRGEWRRELEAIVGCHVSLENITPDEPGTAIVENWVLVWRQGNGSRSA